MSRPVRFSAMITRSLEGNWLRLKPHIDNMDRGDTMTNERCLQLCGKPVASMIARVRSYTMRTRKIKACIRDGGIRLMTNIEQATVLPKALVSSVRKVRRSVVAHVGVDVTKLSAIDQRRHELEAARGAFYLAAAKEMKTPKLLGEEKRATK